MTLAIYPHAQYPARYPHEGACSECWSAKLCNHCGASIQHDHGRCTNGRCASCHREVCGDDGATSPGHGFWRDGIRRVTDPTPTPKP